MSLAKTKTLSYGQAINEALTQMLEEDPSMLLIGQGVKSPWYVGSTCTGLVEKFGSKRVIDTPVSENAITGAAVGAAIVGNPTVVVHPRLDFMLFALDPIINEAANWHFMSGGQSNVPVVFWGIINRGGEQGAQHSQALQALFAHIPGLKVVMPHHPADAKGLMIAAIKDKNPVVFIDDRSLYGNKAEVPEEIYEIEIGKAKVAMSGSDVTIVSSSYTTELSLQAAREVKEQGINCEVIDLRTIKPLDMDTILQSVRKTGRLLVVDGGWRSFGTSSEVISSTAESAFDALKAPPRKVALPDVPAPAAQTLEDGYYFNSNTIVKEIGELMKNE